MISTFVMIVFFWETARGYAVTNIPGYDSQQACEAAVKALDGRPSKYGYTVAVCVPGPQLVTPQ